MLALEGFFPVLVRVLKADRWAEYSELVAVFFLQAMAMGMWIVPLSGVLNAHGLAGIRSFAFATTAVAAFISPLIFGAMADRHVSPVRVLRWITLASATTIALAGWGIAHGWPPLVVLALIQIYAICAAPTGSITTTIVLSRLQDSQREFGPIRATATFGWMVGCWLVSGLGIDRSAWAPFGGAMAWLALAGVTYLLPSVPPPPSSGRTTFRERMGWDAIGLLKNHDHRVVFITVALFSIPLAAFYPITPFHLQALGFQHVSAWMSAGQITEIIAMFALAALFRKYRLKWIFAGGLTFGVIRFVLCSFDSPAWLLAGITLHGFSFTFFFVTAQIYLNERVEVAWRARAQALMWLMSSGVGNLAGYLGSGAWFQHCTMPGGVRWTLFWIGVGGAVALVMAYFLIAYHGKSPGLHRAPQPGEVDQPGTT